MSVAGEETTRRAITRTLTAAVRAALSPDAPPKAYAAARDAAQLLGLTGLDRAIRACAEHAGRPRPADVAALVERLLRLTDECEARGDLGVFDRVHAELVALAGELAAYEWGVPAGPDDATAAVPTLTVAQVLEDIPLAGDESRRLAGRLKLDAIAAATLRASLDWLMPAPVSARTVSVHGEPSLAEIRLDTLNPAGLGPAHRVLSAIGGNLGPALDPEGQEGGWIIRVPSFAARPTYLMVMQGDIRLALPWHSVLRLRMAGASGVLGDVRGADHPLLETFAAPLSPSPEYPMVLVGHGLKRAWLQADRLFWRLMADPCENPGAPPASGLSVTVRTDDGEVFWRADPGELLRRVEVPPPPRRAAPAAPAVVTAPPASTVAPSGETAGGAPPASTAAAPGETAGETPSPAPAVTLGEAHVEPVNAPPASGAPAGSRSAAAASVMSPPQASEVEGPPRALVAEDSLTGRIFLCRLLEQLGFTTDSVGTAAELMARLPQGPWTVVLADVDLPDEQGAPWLRRVREAAATTALVALVRDAAEADLARQAGVAESLEKPFGRTALVGLLVRMGFANSGS